jgi:hypothetical protein
MSPSCLFINASILEAPFPVLFHQLGEHCCVPFLRVGTEAAATLQSAVGGGVWGCGSQQRHHGNAGYPMRFLAAI